jgi:hypothetical protein
MKRTAIITIAVGALVFVAPSASLAHHHHHHHPRSLRHHAHAHHPRAGRPTPPSSTASTSEPGDSAGKVLSFSEGVLTIQPSHGPTVSATVTAATEITCEAPEGTASASAPAAAGSGTSGGQEGDAANNNGEATGSPPWLSPEPSVPGGDELANGGGDPPTEEVALEGQPCGASALLPGALLQQAEMRIGPSGATFAEIVLIG